MKSLAISLFSLLILCRLTESSFESSSTSDYFGVDVSTPVTPDDATCFRNKENISFAVARAWHSYGAYDNNVVGTALAFNNAGIKFDVYMFPCSFTIPAVQQIGNLIGNLTRDKVQYNRIWFDIETNTSPGCGWSTSNQANNCQFFTSLVQAAATNFPNVAFGVYSSMHMWTTIISSDPNGCAVASQLPLWYPHYQSPPQPNFQDFVSFGGWTTPTAKQYGNTNSECSVGVDNNWRPTPPQ